MEDSKEPLMFQQDSTDRIEEDTHENDQTLSKQEHIKVNDQSPEVQDMKLHIARTKL